MGGMFGGLGNSPGLGVTPTVQSPFASAFSSPGMDPVTLAMLTQMQGAFPHGLPGGAAPGVASNTVAQLPGAAGTALGAAGASPVKTPGMMPGTSTAPMTPFPQFPGSPQIPTPPVNASPNAPIIPPVAAGPNQQSIMQLLQGLQGQGQGLGNLGSLFGGTGAGVGGGLNMSGLSGLLRNLFGGSGGNGTSLI